MSVTTDCEKSPKPSGDLRAARNRNHYRITESESADQARKATDGKKTRRSPSGIHRARTKGKTTDV